MQTAKIWLFLLIFFVSRAGQKATAQVVPDNTLGAESSVINSVDELRDRIEGGATRGENLFHSFQEFSIGEGLEVYFVNPEGITNIFSRVTGSNISEIFGTLGVEGTANLFFLNPNGIVFGENAFVDVGGSFIATTASSIEFENGSSFSVRGNNPKVTLIWDAPIGLGLDNNSGKIVVQGTGNNLLVTPDRLIVEGDNLPSAQTEISTGEGLALIGNGVEFDGGVLAVSAKKIEIGSVAQGKVNFSLSPQWEFDYSQVEKLGNISLDNFSLIDLNGNEAIEANLEGNMIELQNGSLILFRKTRELATNVQQRININAEDKLLHRGLTTDKPPSSEGLSRGLTGVVTQNSIGKAININIETKDLILESGGIINTLTSSEGLSGNIRIDSTNSIDISGSIPDNPTLAYSGISSNSLGEANSSSIEINTQKLSITKGGNINGIAINSGNGGAIEINAQESILIDGLGFSKDGNLGAVSVISGVAYGSGISGDININTTDLLISNGGGIVTASFSEATAGSININANSIVLDGFSKGGVIEGSDLARSAITSFVSRPNARFIEGVLVIPTNPIISGNSGNISLNTNSLTIKDNAILTVQNDGIGNAGNIEINTNSISLEQSGSITAASASGQGGNIELNTEQLQLIDNSNISTSAEGLGDGGNININTDTLVAVGDSDITATAVQGNGGNINITSGAILGIEERRATPGNGTSDIDASSEFGEDGTVTISDPQVFIQDPLTLIREVDISKLSREIIEQTCDEGRAKIKDLRHADFYTNPDNFSDQPDFKLSENFVPPQEEKTQVNSLEELLEHLVAQAKNPQPGDPIVSANQIVTLPNGRRFLVPKGQWEYIESRCNIPELQEEPIKN